ncbi:MAG TPA: hypothetical protein VK638_51870, partial [Edaphobacter sp.]|nr:hypothetical protein [Edaphobacter sp.]
MNISNALVTLNTQLKDPFRSLSFISFGRSKRYQPGPRMDVAVGLLRIHAVMKTARQMILGKKRTFHLPNIPSRQLSPRKRTRETLP